MALENFEKIELIPESEVVNDTVEPLEDNSNESNEISDETKRNI